MSASSTHPATRTLQCRHIHTDGRRCGSPCVRTQEFCFYHGKARPSGPRQPQVRSLNDRKNSTFELPSPADLAERSGVQLALGHILHKIAHNELDPRRAGLLLYGLQIASMNLPRERAPRAAKAAEAAELVDELVQHPVHGPLAPIADWEENCPKSTLEQIWDRFERDHALTPSNENLAAPIPALSSRPEEHSSAVERPAVPCPTLTPTPTSSNDTHATPNPTLLSRPGERSSAVERPAVCYLPPRHHPGTHFFGEASLFIPSAPEPAHARYTLF